MQDFPHDELCRWFKEEQRTFPWRGTPTPYEVWISEVMLQQTQAAVVLPYFERWMEHFPTIHSLAQASLEEVIKIWEGLGYYSRARNLHAAARYLVQVHGGELPRDRKVLESIKGLGPYTIGAILSFAFHQKAAAVDANVARVLARFFLIEEDIARPAVKKELQRRTEILLPEKEPWVTMEALIELGAQVCQKQPKCYRCPLQSHCAAFHQGKASVLPIKGGKKQYVSLLRLVPVIHAENEVLVRKGVAGKVMADLYEFPYFEIPRSLLEKEMRALLGLDLLFSRDLPEEVHSFTRFRVRLLPSLWKSLEKRPVVGYEWVPWAQLVRLPFSSGHRRILHQIKSRV